MTLTLDIRPEIQAELARQAAAEGRAIEAVAVALLERLVCPEPARASSEVADACERLKTFGKRHGLSLGGMSMRELRHEARP